MNGQPCGRCNAAVPLKISNCACGYCSDLRLASDASYVGVELDCAAGLCCRCDDNLLSGVF